jgi:hypothetical protein
MQGSFSASFADTLRVLEFGELVGNRADARNHRSYCKVESFEKGLLLLQTYYQKDGIVILYK